MPFGADFGCRREFIAPFEGTARVDDHARAEALARARIIGSFTGPEFAQKKFGFTREVLGEAYKVMVDALSNDGIVEDGVLQSAIGDAKTAVNVTKPVRHADVVDCSFLREAIRNKM